MMHKFTLLLFGMASVVTLHAQSLDLVELCTLPSEVSETSGLENGPNKWFWTHNDSGNPAELYCIDTLGVIQRTVKVVGDVNIDWEELAKDDDGNLYIGNFGNNALNRTDLRIVKIPSVDTCTGTTYVTDTIRLSYADQTDFPPVAANGNFDMEAMVWYNDSLHLFSKDRSVPYTGYTKHYKLPEVGGDYSAQLVDSFYTGGTSYFSSITAADFSEDNSQLVLLNADRIWLFSNYTGSNFFGGDVSEMLLGSFTQKEGVCFRHGFIYITDEDAFGIGRKMYRVHPSTFVGVDDKRTDIRVRPVYNNRLQLQEIVADNTDEQLEWRLLDTAGRLISNGESENNRISKGRLNASNGVFVIQLFYKSKPIKALLVKL
ncbi:hypothetical protein ACFLR1_00280 [Bacteroidota bacterium]